MAFQGWIRKPSSPNADLKSVHRPRQLQYLKPFSMSVEQSEKENQFQAEVRDARCPQHRLTPNRARAALQAAAAAQALAF